MILIENELTVIAAAIFICPDEEFIWMKSVAYMRGLPEGILTPEYVKVFVL